jgi:hypothetical protein
VDEERFDALAVKFGDAGSSRRTILQRCGGGLAALLAGFGILAAGEDAAAKRKRRSRRKRRKKQKRRRPQSPSTGPANNSTQVSFPITIGPLQQCTPGAPGTCPIGASCVAVAPGSAIGVCLSNGIGGIACTPGAPAGCPAGDTCITVGGLNVCVPASLGSPCSSGADCPTGACDASGQCALCPSICGSPGSQVCCVVSTQCIGGTTCVVSS